MFFRLLKMCLVCLSLGLGFGTSRALAQSSFLPVGTISAIQPDYIEIQLSVRGTALPKIGEKLYVKDAQGVYRSLKVSAHDAPAGKMRLAISPRVPQESLTVTTPVYLRLSQTLPGSQNLTKPKPKLNSKAAAPPVQAPRQAGALYSKLSLGSGIGTFGALPSLIGSASQPMLGQLVAQGEVFGASLVEGSALASSSLGFELSHALPGSLSLAPPEAVAPEEAGLYQTKYLIRFCQRLRVGVGPLVYGGACLFGIQSREKLNFEANEASASLVLERVDSLYGIDILSRWDPTESLALELELGYGFMGKTVFSEQTSGVGSELTVKGPKLFAAAVSTQMLLYRPPQATFALVLTAKLERKEITGLGRDGDRPLSLKSSEQRALLGLGIGFGL